MDFLNPRPTEPKPILHGTKLFFLHYTEARAGGSLTGQASMSSQASQPIMPLVKPPPSSFATIASRLAPQDSVDKSPRLSLSSVKSQHSKEIPVKARVSFFHVFSPKNCLLYYEFG